MNTDPLAAYRRRPLRPETTEAEEPDNYVAFVGKDHVPFLEIRPNVGLAHAPQYLMMVNVSCNWPEHSCFIIHYNFMDVFVNGRNLRDVVSAVRYKRAALIQSFNKNLWPDPTDPKAPFIQSIEFEFHDKPGRFKEIPQP